MILRPKLDKLPPSQRKLWAELGQVGLGFVLYGGTAISVRIAHRESVDFDLFSSRPFDPEKLLISILKVLWQRSTFKDYFDAGPSKLIDEGLS